MNVIVENCEISGIACSVSVSNDATTQSREVKVVGENGMHISLQISFENIQDSHGPQSTTQFSDELLISLAKQDFERLITDHG